MNERIAIIDGIRTPFGAASGTLASLAADDLGAIPIRELCQRYPELTSHINEVIVGNVATPPHAANIGRVCALKAGLDQSVPAITVSRNCASGMEAITTGAAKLLSGECRVVVAAGTESMSNIPFFYRPEAVAWFTALAKAKRYKDKWRALIQCRPRFFSPIIGVKLGLTDPTCGLIMGLTAENLAREFGIRRDEQDHYAYHSHQKTAEAAAQGLFDAERMAIFSPPAYAPFVDDESVRPTLTLEKLARLRPYFDRDNGSVTVGNSCSINDGAAAMLLMRESDAREQGYTPLGYLSGYAYAGLSPSRMGLGPVYATHKLFQKTGRCLADMDMIEINEAFAVQVLACMKAFSSAQFCQTHLDHPHALGDIRPDTLNVWGGSIAIGHPVGTTGLRLVLTLLQQLRHYGKQTGLASLCVGGGQGAALLVESC